MERKRRRKKVEGREMRESKGEYLYYAMWDGT